MPETFFFCCPFSFFFFGPASFPLLLLPLLSPTSKADNWNLPQTLWERNKTGLLQLQAILGSTGFFCPKRACSESQALAKWSSTIKKTRDEAEAGRCKPREKKRRNPDGLVILQPWLQAIILGLQQVKCSLRLPCNRTQTP